MTILIIAILSACVIYFFYQKNRFPGAEKSEKLPDTLKTILGAQVQYYQKLDKKDQERFENQVNDLLKYVRIEGVGTTVTDIDRVLIASSGVIPIFGFPGWKYNNLTNIILYPDTFDQEFQFEGENRNILGMVGSGYMNGQMLLSRDALLKGCSKSAGRGNAAIHEFVHLLDKSDGETDGVPENLLEHQYTVPWLKMMHQEMHKIEAGKSDIDPYATTNEAEFLAVAAEYFFEKPDQLKHKHPEIYGLLSQIFAQDPALPESSPINATKA